MITKRDFKQSIRKKNQKSKIKNQKKSKRRKGSKVTKKSLSRISIIIYQDPKYIHGDNQARHQDSRPAKYTTRLE